MRYLVSTPVVLPMLILLSGCAETAFISHASWEGFEPIEALRWDKSGFTYEEAKVWKSIGFHRGEDSYVYAKSFRNLGFTPELAGRWIELVGSSQEYGLQNARYWLKKAFTPEETLDWAYVLGNGDKNTADVALTWKKYGFGHDEILSWKRNGFDPNAALAWKKQGVNAKQSSNYRDMQIRPSEFGSFLRAIKKYCPEGLSDENIYDVDPQEVQGRCFYLNGTVTRSIDRTNALVNVDSGELVKINFIKGSSLSKNNSFDAIIFGKGVKAYHSTVGKKVMPGALVIIPEALEIYRIRNRDNGTNRDVR